ncbi:RNA polymerase sigma factor [Thermodesulfobacteriota bacterium]
MPDNLQTLTRFFLETLYIELEKPLFNVVFRYIWNREEAQDLVQESFIRLWKMRERVNMKTVKPLAYRICLNLAASSLRRKKILSFLSLDKLIKEPINKDNTSPEQEEEIQLLRKVIDGLPSKLKETVLLTEFSELSYKEIGESLGIPAGTVGSRRNRAINIMKEKFRKIYGE